MATRGLTGARIRARRLDRGVKQAELAAAAGISASYLNLIEHNRRRIGGSLLARIADVLETDPVALSEGAEARDLARLSEAAGVVPGAGAEVDRVEEFAGRFPGWAALTVGLADRVAALEARIGALTDRLAHDPRLSGSLHDILSAVTSIRSTASILVQEDGLDAEWRARFHRNLFDEAVRLADRSSELTGLLESPAEGGGTTASVREEVEGWMQAAPELPGALEHGTGLADLLRAAPLSATAREFAAERIALWAEDAARLRQRRFTEAVRAAGDDLVAVAFRLGSPLASVLRRRALLGRAPGLGPLPPVGYLEADTAGQVLFHLPVPGQILPPGGPTCPLWPLFGALSQPGRPLRLTVRMPGEAGAAFDATAIAEPVEPAPLSRPPVLRSVMVLRPVTAAPEGDGVQPVGPACRVCPRPACTARREPSLLSDPARVQAL